MKLTQALPRMLALLAGLFMLTGVLAAEPAEEGTDYQRLAKPVPVETGKQVEVVEFFWYRCPHCNQLEPGLEAWVKKLPADVRFRAVPAILNPNWLPAAKLHYALADVGALDRLRGKVFDAYHKDKIDLDDETVLMAWIRKQGVDEARFKAAYRSFSVQTRAMKGAQTARNAGISGVPVLMVDGKYLTAISMTYTEERLFEVLDQLVQRARAERGGKALK
ncbi:thiol:disulfide interchange protein DsbA/DsbL [Betaproteobacteria bacterium SCN2]|jgi:thiol:disulfide interchange protein DsbA|nr:thiol:disulfide interchange protein DsbA/DsbL [Betaproteobacteria bacterium SCN2]